MRVQHVQQRVGPVVEAERECRGDGRGYPVPAHGDECLLAGGPHETERLTDVQDVGKPLQRMLRAVREIRVAEKSLEEIEARLEPPVGHDCDGGMPMNAAVAVSSAPWPGVCGQERGWVRRHSGAGP